MRILLPVLFILLAHHAYADDFQKALSDSGISGSGIEGTIEPDGKVRITSGSLASVPAGTEVLIDGAVDLAGTRIAGKGYYMDGELVNAYGSSSLEMKGTMEDIVMLEDGGFRVKTRGQEITLAGGSVEGIADGTRVIADDRIIVIGTGIAEVDARGKDIMIDGRQVIFNGVWPERIDRADGRYEIRIFERKYATTGRGIEFLLDRVLLPENSMLSEGAVAVTATKGALEWHFSRNFFEMSVKSAVLVEQGKITGKAAPGGEISISTGKAEHIIQNSGKETLKTNAMLDARLHLKQRINGLDPVKIREGRFSFETFQLQQWLSEAGYYSGKLDGLAGKGTKDALNGYLADNGLPQLASLNENERMSELLGLAAERQRKENHIIVLDRKSLPDIVFDESRIRSDDKVIARNSQPVISEQEIGKLDRKLEESAPRLMLARPSLDDAVDTYFSDYTPEQKRLIREHMEAKLVQETEAGAYLARINNQMIPSKQTLPENARLLSESIAGPLENQELSRASFGLGQVTLQRFVDLLEKDESLQQMTGITEPSMSALYGNRLKQLEYASKLIDPDINAAILAASTRDYLDLCRGDIDCEAAIHNAGPDKARFGVPFKAKVWYLRQKVKDINPG